LDATEQGEEGREGEEKGKERRSITDLAHDDETQKR